MSPSMEAYSANRGFRVAVSTPSAFAAEKKPLASAPEAPEQVVVAVEAETPMVEATLAPTSEPEAPAVAVIADEPAALPASIEAVVETVADVEDIPATAAEVEASTTPAAEVDRAERLRSLFEQARESEPDVATTTNAAPPAPSVGDEAGDDQAPRNA